MKFNNNTKKTFLLAMIFASAINSNVFVSSFSDISNVKSYLLYEVLIPSAKKTITDMVSNGIAMLLGTDPVRRDKDKIRGGSVKVSYRDYYETQRERGSVKSFGRSIDYDEIIFDTRIDAESVLVRMEEIIDKYEFVSISDLYEMADLSAPPYTATKYGWVSLVNAEVVRVYDGYKIKLPRPVPRD